MSSRVSKILELNEVDQWRPVPTYLNVADICSRDTARNVSDYENILFKGPNFLYDKEDIWSMIPTSFRETEDIFSQIIMSLESVLEITPIKSHYYW